MIAPRYVPVLLRAILSGTMSLIVSAISTLRVLALDSDFVPAWLECKRLAKAYCHAIRQVISLCIN